MLFTDVCKLLCPWGLACHTHVVLLLAERWGILTRSLLRKEIGGSAPSLSPSLCRGNCLAALWQVCLSACLVNSLLLPDMGSICCIIIGYHNNRLILIEVGPGCSGWWGIWPNLPRTSQNRRQRRAEGRDKQCAMIRFTSIIGVVCVGVFVVCVCGVCGVCVCVCVFACQPLYQRGPIDRPSYYIFQQKGAAANVIVLQPTKTAMTFCDADLGRRVSIPALSDSIPRLHHPWGCFAGLMVFVLGKIYFVADPAVWLTTLPVTYIHLYIKCVIAGRIPKATSWHGSRCDPRESRHCRTSDWFRLCRCAFPDLFL